MEEKSTNNIEELKSLYASKVTLLIPELKELEKGNNKPANPLFINIDEVSFRRATIRIMFFGQETNSWGDQVKGRWENSLEHYSKFFNKNINENDYKGAFWPSIRKLKKNLNTKVPNSDIQYVWNNIYKVGNQNRGKNRPYAEVREKENKFFDVINQEIEILKPNILLFFTGTKYEARLKKKMGNFNSVSLSHDIDVKKLARIELSNNILAYRTYHPKYLQLNKNFDLYINLIIEDIIKHKELFKPAQ